MIINWIHEIQDVALIIKEEEKKQTLYGWNGHIVELFHRERGQPAIHRNIEGPDILKFEVKSMLAALDDLGISMITDEIKTF